MHRPQAMAVALIGLLLASVLAMTVTSVHLTLDDAPMEAGMQSETQFTDGTTELAGLVGSNINPTVPIVYGHTMTDGTLTLSLEGQRVTHSDAFTVSSGALNGTLNDTVNDGNTVQLVTAVSGPPQAGTNSSTVLSTTNLAGTHAYDTLELLCGIASCGRIVATGDLTLYVNTLRIEQGTAVVANDMTTGGTGAGGSTTTPSNGRNDGGGGAGHGGSGGAGGGTNGGSGGSTYGNGSERGSQGGTVSSSLHNTANGGNGGGYIQIFANQVFVNGSLQAHGGDGDSGSQASAGTGPGGSGGGGGSGGSIAINANTVTVGNGGQIKADGGDGGDGANGAQNGPGFGMYDGGDGGGGGGGGRIIINTQQGGYSNAGTVAAIGGNGGTKGLKYGTGVDGVDGNSGSNGVVITGTWAGYVSNSNLTSNNGTFISNPIETQSVQPSTAYVTHNAAVPMNASLTVLYRSTLNGSDASWDEWTAWSPLSLSGQWVERHRWIQLHYTFTRTGSNSPELSGFTVEHTSWTSLSGTEFRYDGTLIGPTLTTTELGLTTSFTNSGTSSQPQLTLQTPVGSEFTDELRFWMQWPSASAGQTPSLVSVGLDGNLVNTTAQNWAEGGVDIGVSAGALNAVVPSNTWTDANGLEWHNLTLDIDMTDTTDVWFGHVHVPWTFTTEVNLTQAVNDVILYECSSFYAFTNPSCFGPATSHRFSLTGQTQPTGSPGFTYAIKEPMFEWEDRFAPQVSAIQHRQGVEQLPDLRVNETFSIVLFDTAGEDDLTVEYLGNHWEPSQGFGEAQTLAYHNALQGYYLYLNTDGLETDFQHDFNMTFRVMDSNGNELLPRPTYNLTVYPVAPVVASLSVSGPTSIGVVENRWNWGINEANLSFAVTDQHDRESLMVMAELTHPSSTQPVLLPMLWDLDARAYTALWMPMREDLGEWDVEIRMTELGGLEGTDEDGWKAGPDLTLRLVDNDGPEIVTITTNDPVEQGDTLELMVSWTGEAGETYQGSIAVRSSEGEVMNKTVLPTTERSTSMVFDTTEWEPGTYTIDVFLIDDAHNPATHAASGPVTVTVLKPWLEHNLSVAVEGSNTLVVSGLLSTRSGSGVLEISQTDGTWTRSMLIEDGMVNASFEMDELLSPTSAFAIEVCDENNTDQCDEWTVSLDFTEAFALDVRGQCLLSLVNESSTLSQTLVECTVTNNGLVDITARFVVDPADNLTALSDVVSPGETTSVTIDLNAGDSPLNTTVSWTMLVNNAGGEQKVVDMGQVNIVRAAPAQTTVDDDDGVAAQGRSSVVMGMLVVLVVLGLLGAAHFYRKAGSLDELDKNVPDFAVTNDLSQALAQDETATTDGDPQHVPPAQDEAVVDGGVWAPHAGLPPTSVDGNGYEWYSTEQGHWYRTEGSQSDWLPYES